MQPPLLPGTTVQFGAWAFGFLLQTDFYFSFECCSSLSFRKGGE